MIRFIVSHRVPVALVLLAATLVLAMAAGGLQAEPGVESLMPTRGGDLGRLREFNELFGPDEVIVLAVHAEPLFTAENLARLEALTVELEELPHVVRVLSPTSARDIDGDELGPFDVTPYELFQDGEISAEELGELLASHPFYGDFLVASDGRTAALMVSVERIENDGDYRAATVARVRERAAALAPEMTAHVAGIPVEKVDVPEFIARDQRVVVPLIVLVMTLVTALLYRHPVGIVIPVGVMLMSLAWVLGIFAYSGRSLNPVTSLLSPVIMVVSIAGAIHYLNHFLTARAAGLDKVEALERAFRRARIPCFNAALTTAVGFGALGVIPIPAIREFGAFTALGVLCAYVLTMVAVPVGLAFLSGLGARRAKTFKPGMIERLLVNICEVIHHHPIPVALGVLAVVGLITSGLVHLRVDTDMLRSLRTDSALYQAAMYIDDNLTGVNSVEIVIPDVDPADPELLLRVHRFERAVAALPGVRKVSGLPDLYARVNRAFNEGDDEFEVVPQGPEASEDIAAADELLAEAASDVRDRFVSADGACLCVTARIHAMSTSQGRALFSDIKAAAGQAGLKNIELTGGYVVLTNMSTYLVRSQVRGLATALVVILALLSVQFRSLRLGILCAVPSMVPVAMVYGLMGWVGIALSVPTTMIASVAIGMTVDNTIHLMARYRQEYEQDGDRMIALEAMMTGCGRALVYSTLTLALGFATGMIGSFRPTMHFAALTGATLVLGLASVVVVLPLLLVVFEPVHLRKAAAVAVVVAALALGGVALAGETPSEAPVLGDQFGGTGGPGLHEGAPVLLLHGEASSLRRMKVWENKTKERVGDDLQVVRVVDLRELEGKKTEDEVKKRLLDRVPEDIAILLDWQGAVATFYGLPVEDVQVSATVLDGQGRACVTLDGAAAPGSLDVIARRIEVLAAGEGCPAP